MLTITDWRELAACLDSDPILFFPIGTTGPAVEQIELARAPMVDVTDGGKPAADPHTDDDHVADLAPASTKRAPKKN